MVSLDATTGCVYWSTVAAAQVRSGLTVAVVNGTPTVFFGDVSGQVYAIDAATGKPLWQLAADTHPAAIITATPAYYDGRLYVGVASYEEASAVNPQYVCCTFRGSIMAIDAKRVRWYGSPIQSPMRRGPESRPAAG